MIVFRPRVRHWSSLEQGHGDKTLEQFDMRLISGEYITWVVVVAVDRWISVRLLVFQSFLSSILFQLMEICIQRFQQSKVM